MSKSSLEAFSEWIAELPKTQRDHISLLVIAYLPGCDIPLEPIDTCYNRFMEWIASHVQNQKTNSHIAMKALGIALALRPIVNFTVMNRIGEKGHWKKQSKNVETLISGIKNNLPNDSENIKYFENHLNGLQFREAQDLKMKEGWNLLCQEYLVEEKAS